MLHEKHKIWIEARGISLALAEKFGLTSTRDASGYWLTVPYMQAGEVVNHKYRMTAEKGHRMDRDAPLCLWNADSLLHPEVLAGAPVIITEGEWDALIAMEAEFQHVVSVPNGGPKEATHEPENAKRYSWVWRHLADLDRVKTFILATDDDDVGKALATDIVALLGADRCRFVTYPAGCKDLNEVALAHDLSAVRKVINGAKPYPIEGLYKPSDFPPRAPLTTYKTGIPALDGKLHIIPGTLTVFTGYANIGKSTVLSAIIAHQIALDRAVCVAPFETDIEILKDSLRQSIAGCARHAMTQSLIDDVDELMERNLSVIYQAVDENLEMDLDRFLDLARIAVVQHGAKMVVIDPWNELEHKRRNNETETEYTNRALKAMRRFADRHQVAFWVVAHPAKPEKGFTGVPKLYQIAGSAAWANKPHFGLTYHRRDPSKNIGELHVTKIKQGYPGEKTGTDGISVTLDYRTWQFVEAPSA